MNDATVAAIVTGVVTVVPIVLTQLFAHLTSMRKREEDREEAKAEAKAALDKIEEVHKATNGLTEKLSAAKLMEGKAEGAEAQRVQAAVEESLRAQGRAEVAAAKPIPASANGLVAPAGASAKDDKAEISIEGKLVQGTVNVDKQDK